MQFLRIILSYPSIHEGKKKRKRGRKVHKNDIAGGLVRVYGSSYG
jgi:hypothetical protein